LKTRTKTKDYDKNMSIGKYGADEHNKLSKHQFFKSEGRDRVKYKLRVVVRFGK